MEKLPPKTRLANCFKKQKSRGEWRTVFCSVNSFMVWFTSLLILYGMSGSYMSSVLPSIEKRFGFSSKAMGTILAIKDVGIVLVALITGHFAGKGHRPRGICIGGCLCGFALLLFAAPEIIFPVETTSIVGRIISHKHDTLCTHATGNALSLNRTTTDTCGQESSGNLGAFVVFCLAHFLLGAGSTTLMVLGLPFIHDNVPLNNVPIYFAISFSGRIFGPMFGFALGALANSMFLDGSKPSFSSTDPRWISAWYIGFLVTGTGSLILAVLVGLFPPAIRKHDAKLEEIDVDLTKEAATTTSKPESTQIAAVASSTKDFVTNIRRLVTNVAFLCRACSNILDGMVITGFMSFFFKYIAQQYQISPSTASLLGGVPSICGIALGVIAGGIIIKQLHLQPRHVCLMLVLAQTLLCVVTLINLGLGCKRTEIFGLPGSESLNDLYQTGPSNGSFCSASAKCQCSNNEFSPVCDPQTGANFYSPCHAGCQLLQTVNDTKHFHHCSCAGNAPLGNSTDLNDVTTAGRVVVGGFCPQQCGSNLHIFIGIFFMAMLCLGIPLSGTLMLLYRMVDSDLKGMATALLSLLTSALGYLPAPIFTGVLVDSTCRLWQRNSCGVNNFCLLYDTDQFRWKFLVTFAIVKAVGACLDSGVMYKMWNVEFERTAPEKLQIKSRSESFSSSEPQLNTTSSQVVLINSAFDSADISELKIK